MTWDTNNKLTQDTILFDAIGKIRAESDKRREVEARVLAENNLASVRQLSEDKKKQFCAIVDAILAEEKDVKTQLFSEPSQLSEASAKVRYVPFTVAPKPNTQADGAKVEPLIEESDDLQELSKKTLGSYIKKASHDITVKGAATREFANRSREDRKNDNFVGARKNAELSDKTFAKSWKRRTNMAKAVDRLTKEDLEEMYLEIENTILVSEGIDSIDRLNEQGQEKLATVVETIMEDLLVEEETIEEGWFSGGAKKTPTPNPKGAARGERDVGDYKNPTGHANKDVPQAVKNDRKLAKRNNGRLSGEGY